MILSDIIRSVPKEYIFNMEKRGEKIPENPVINSIHYNSRDVKPGGIFVAIKGFAADGHDYIEDALKRGAAAIFSEKPVRADGLFVFCKNTRKILGYLAGNFYDNPSEKMTIIAITGTNGKTTTSLLIENILIKAGFKTGVIGTIDYHYLGKYYENPVTTPESCDLQRILADMKKAGVTHVIMEASSHAIDLGRLENCRFDLGVFTNLSQDHLDYHNDMESYWSVKKRLFTDILTKGPKKDRSIAIINCNDPRGKKLTHEIKIPCITTGSDNKNMVWTENPVFELSGVKGKIHTPIGEFEFSSSLTGAYNIENILSATGAALALGIFPDTIKKGIESVKSVPGRLEPIYNTKGRYVFVDYAHTPDALENVLKTLKEPGYGRMIAIFGCGGDRDRQKRPLMGEIGGKWSDISIITSDNPRTEDPLKIISHILPGIKKICPKEYEADEILNGSWSKGYIVEPDRRKAINLGIKLSNPGDIVVIAGKGHETYQIIGNNTIRFDDRQEARLALEKL